MLYNVLVACNPDGCALLHYNSNGGLGTPVMQAVMTKHVTQSIVGGDTFIMTKCSTCTGDVCVCDHDSPPPRLDDTIQCAFQTRPTRATPVTLLQHASRVAMDAQSGELFVFSEQLEVLDHCGEQIKSHFQPSERKHEFLE